MIDQSNYFAGYSKFSKEKQLAEKNKILLVAQSVKQLLCQISGEDWEWTYDLEKKLNDITTRIQKRINRGTLSNVDLERYAQEFAKEAPYFLAEKFKTYTKCCIFLAKHDTDSKTVTNWFGKTNKTSAIHQLIDTPSEASSEYSQHRLSPIFPVEIAALRLKAGLFHFDHQSSDISSRFTEETQRAKASLENTTYHAAVIDVAKKFQAYLLTLSHENRATLLKNFYDRFKVLGKAGYPIVVIESFEEATELYNRFLTNPTQMKPVQLLSLLWMLGSELVSRKHRHQAALIHQLYLHLIKPSKSHKLDVYSKLPISNTRLGSSDPAEVTSLFREANLRPWPHPQAYQYGAETVSNPYTEDFHKTQTPYICGLSGIANCTCMLLDTLDIAIDSEPGRNFAEAMAGYIVGTGAHSYTEVYASFNLYHEICQGTSMAGVVESVQRSTTPYADLVSFRLSDKPVKTATPTVGGTLETKGG